VNYGGNVTSDLPEVADEGAKASNVLPFAAPDAPNVTPEPAPPDTKLILLSASGGAITMVLILATWLWWRRR
jgi:hypothetical protein